jgi:hypothetical protein
MAAAKGSGRAPMNLRPSAPFLCTARTQRRAASALGVDGGKNACTRMRGALISPASASSRCLRVQARPIIAPGSRTVVMPCASHSLSTYSGSVSDPAGGVGWRAEVRVGIDKARQHVAAGGIDHLGIGALPCAVMATGRTDGGNAVPRDLDVHRADRRRAGAIDEDRIGDQELFERPAGLVTARRRDLRRCKALRQHAGDGLLAGLHGIGCPQRRSTRRRWRRWLRSAAARGASAVGT